jgi:uncharacterized protein
MAQSKMAQSKPPANINTPTAKAMSKCPICGAPSELEQRPFCSRRCADVDLSRWLRGAYVIQGSSQDDDEDGDGADAPPEPPIHRDENEN